MGIHHQTTHGRVFRGVDAKNHLEMHKRDSHGNKIKMNIPKHMLAAARPADAAQTNYPAPAANGHAHKVALRPADPAQISYSVAQKEAVKTIDSVVYVTMSADFTGSTAGYVTLTPTSTPSAATSEAQTAAPEATSTAQQSPAAAAQSSASDNAATSSVVVSSSTVTVSPTSSSAPVNNKSMFLNPPSTALAAATTSSASFAGAVLGGTPLAATRSGATVVGGTPVSATRAAQINQTSTGMSGGAKAGLAIGILLAIALAGGLLFFCFRRRKNQNNHEELIDEKHASSIFGGKGVSAPNGRMSTASMNTTHTAATAPRLSLRPVTQFLPNLSDNRKSAANAVHAAMSEKPKSMWERRDQTSQNPFDDAAVLSEKQVHGGSPSNNPFDEPEANAENGRTSPSSFRSANSGSHSQKASWEGSEPPTPKSTKFGTASAVAVSAAGTASAVPPMPKVATPNNVHRVQLDFKPSMEDELELISGQLVRMLHEYDDGWALCIRMDRSQQGVCPRTCLSKVPVKPRQGPPPANNNSRPSTPQGPNGMYPRPLTPTGRQGSSSSSEEQQEQQSTGAVPARKPVPGQAA